MLTIKTVKGLIQVKAGQKYKLLWLMNQSNDQLKPFYDLFHIGNFETLIRILYDNDLIDNSDDNGDKMIINHPSFYYWLSKSEDDIRTIMTEKGIWFNGMTKYFGIKVLLSSHSIVSSQNYHNPDQIKDQNTQDQNTQDHNTQNQNTQDRKTLKNIDDRKSITTGTHYESLPPRDFEIDTKREKIRNHMLFRFDNNHMITSFSGNDLEEMYRLYDNYCFDNNLSNMIKEKNRTIKFSPNITSESKAGEHGRDGNVHTIRISSYLVGKLFVNGEKTIKTNGLVIYDRLGGLMNVFEHEITHLYCSLMGYTRKIKQGEGKMYYSPHGKLFQELVFRFFGHTDYRHNFNNGDVEDQIVKEDCKVGMDVYFDMKSGKVYGKIIKINIKRCKVNTESGSTYDVPFEMLRRSDREVKIPENKTIENKTGENLKDNYSVGMKVSFSHNKKMISGKIIKCNPKRAKIESNIGKYDVPYHMLM